MTAAGRAVWDWKDRQGDREQQRALAALRREGLVQGFVVLALGFVAKYGLGHARVGDVLVVLGAAQALAGVWRPLWLRPVRRLARALGHGAGLVLGWVLLMPLWLLVVVPASMVLRLRGQDPLQRRALARGLTGWIPRRLTATPASCERQFLVDDRAARALARPEGAPVDPALLAEVQEARR